MAEIGKVKSDVENSQRGYITKYEAVQRLENLISKRTLELQESQDEARNLKQESEKTLL